MAAGQSPLAQFEIKRWVPIEIGDLDISFTNSSTFMVLTVIVDVSYALLAARIGRQLHEPRSKVMRSRLAGLILMLAAIALALLNV